MSDDLIANLPDAKANPQDRAALASLLIDDKPSSQDDSFRKAIIVAVLVMLFNNSEVTSLLEKNIPPIQGSPLGMLVVKGGLAGLIFFLISLFNRS